LGSEPTGYRGNKGWGAVYEIGEIKGWVKKKEYEGGCMGKKAIETLYIVDLWR